MPNPHWRIRIDWNDNGTWAETSGAYREDVTPDVLDLDWRWGQPVGSLSSPRRAEPARLHLTLGNEDHRYTPGNARSPLSGNLAAGRRVWAAFAWPLDNFAGADGTDLNGRAVPLGDTAWAKISTGPAGLALTQGRAVATAGTGGAIYTLDFGDADAHLGCIFRRSGNGSSGVALRVANQWDYLRVSFSDAATLLEDVTFGFPSVLRRGDPLVAGRDYFIEIEMHGGSVHLYATDLSNGEMDRKEILDGGGTAGNAAATRHGIWHDGSAAAAADRWDDFGGWRSFFHGALVRISPERDPDLGQVCRVHAEDDLRTLERRPLYNLFSQRLLSSATIASGILTWAGFNPNYRHLDQGQTLVASSPRALWRVSAAAALADLAEEENGRIYVDGRGYFRLEDADHRHSGPHAASRATLRDTAAAGAYFSALEWDEGSEGVENSVIFRYRLAVSQGAQEIWRLRDVPAIPAGESRDFLAESGSYDAVDGIRLPVAVTDYAANSRSRGDGDDLTASMAVTLPHVTGGALASPSDHYVGRGTVVRVTNTHATTTAYITLLKLTANRAYQAPDPTSYRAENAASQAAHGLRAHTVDCRFIDHYEAARVASRRPPGRSPPAPYPPGSHHSRLLRRQPGPHSPPRPVRPYRRGQQQPRHKRRLLHRGNGTESHRPHRPPDRPLAAGGGVVRNTSVGADLCVCPGIGWMTYAVRGAALSPRPMYRREWQTCVSAPAPNRHTGESRYPEIPPDGYLARGPTFPGSGFRRNDDIPRTRLGETEAPPRLPPSPLSLTIPPKLPEPFAPGEAPL